MKLLFILFIGSLSFHMYGQNYDPQKLIPIDSTYRTGSLSNGIQYIIRKNNFNEKKAYFYAFFNVGAIQEEPNEYGFAHFIEHMSYHGKESYNSFLESIGFEFGKDYNGSTGLESTRYNILGVSSKSDKALDSSLLFLKDLSFSLSLCPEDIEKERKIILEEWRLTKGDLENDSMAGQVFVGSKYDRPGIIGDTAILNHFSVNSLERFYKLWYRTDHFAIIAIGDFDPMIIEEKIKRVFGKIPQSQGYSTRETYKIPDNKGPIVVQKCDPEIHSTNLSIHYKHNNPIKYDHEQLRIECVDNLINYMFQNRLDHIVNNLDTPFGQASASFNINYFNTTAHSEYLLNATSNKNEIIKALTGILLENERVIQTGFNDIELQAAKNYLHKLYSIRPLKKDQLPPEEFVIQCYYYILKGKIPVSLVYMNNFINNILPLITLQEVNQRFKNYTKGIEPLISICIPKKNSTITLSDSEIKKIMATLRLQKLTPYAGDTLILPFFDKALNPGKVVKQSFNDSLNTTEWTLSNGIKVIIKTTSFDDNICFEGLQNNDSLLKQIKREYLPSLVYGGLSLKEMGVDRYSKFQLGKMLAGKRVSVEPILSILSQGYRGSSSGKDFEIALQLIHLHYLYPRWDEKILKEIVTSFQPTKYVPSPYKVLDDTINKYRSIRKSFQKTDLNLNLVSLEKFKKIRQILVNNPTRLTFLFVGNIKPEAIQLLIEKYLGSLPVQDYDVKEDDIFEPNKTNSVEEGKKWFETGLSECFFEYPMKVPRASIFVCCQGVVENAPDKLLYGELAQNLLIKQCESVIRGKFGATYRVTPYNYALISPDYWQASVYFETNPNFANQMKSITLDEIRKFMSGSIKTEDFDNLKQILYKRRTEELNTNNWWVSKGLHEFYFNNKNIVSTYLDEVKDLSLTGLKAFTKDIYNQGNIIDVIMIPK